jgi:hypothetical protein
LVLRINGEGEILSAREFGETQPGLVATALAAAPAAGGGILFAGQFGNSVWSMKVAADDTLAWQRTFAAGAALGESGQALIELAGGAVAVAGGRRLSVNDSQAFVLFLGGDGTLLQMNGYGAVWPLRRAAYGMTLTAAGRLQLVGEAAYFGTWSWAAVVNADGTVPTCSNAFPLVPSVGTSALVPLNGAVTATDLPLTVRRFVPVPVSRGVRPQPACN